MALALLALGLPCASAHAQTLSIGGYLGAHHRVAFPLGRVGERTVTRAVLARGAWRRQVDVGRVVHPRRAGVLVVSVPSTLARTGRTPKLVLTLEPSRAMPTSAPPPPAPEQSAPTQPEPEAQPAAADPAPEPPPPPQPAPGDKAPLLPPGSPVLSDSEAAAHVRPVDGEVRPDNDAANHRVPTDDELADYRSQAENWRRCNSYHRLVTGNFTGNTDEIIQWAAWKWGLDEDIVRADAAVETRWVQSFLGDDGDSFGVLQVKRTAHPGTYPLSEASTAFNVDYYAAAIRYYYDGCAPWLEGVDHGQDYAAGDIWGSVGAWFAGRWHTPAAEDYIAKVQDDLAQRVWEQPAFDSAAGP